MIYIITYILFMFSLLLGIVSFKLRSALCYVMLFFLIFIAGFRYYVGTDYKTYVLLANNIYDGLPSYMEFGFVYLLKISHFLGFNTQFVFLISSYITMILFFKYFKENSNDILFSLFLFFLFPVFFFASFNGVRQFIAVGIFLYSTRFILSRSFIKFFSCVLFGALFHYTILLMIPCFFVFNRVHKLYVYIVIAAIYGIATNLLGHYGMLLGGPKKYFTDVFDYGFNIKSLVPVVLFLMMSFLYKKYYAANKDAVLSFNFLYVSSLIVLTPIVSSLPSGLVLRVSSYFTPVMLIVLVNMGVLYKNPVVRFLYFGFVLILATFYFLVTLIDNGESYSLLPYQFNFYLF